MGHFGDTAGETNWWEKYDFDQDAEENQQREEEKKAAEIPKENAQEEAEEEEPEECAPVRVRRAPDESTRKEREEHEATHNPYRSWCRHCVRGRAGSGRDGNGNSQPSPFQTRP